MTALFVVPLALVLLYLAMPLTTWVATLWRAVWRSLLSSRNEPTGEIDRGSVSLLFLVPAHNEEKVISRCVTSLLNQDYPDELTTVAVVADNCDDATPAIARDLGAECFVRVDPEHPGKPHAIAWALAEIGDLSKWDAIVIIDADSEVAPDFSSSLCQAAPLEEKVVQAYYGISNPGDSWLTRLAALLGRARYEVEYPLKARAGLNCPLTGNGMCIGRELLATLGWNAFSLTENWELFADYTVRGIRIDLNNHARLYALETESLSESRTRRSRWLRGRAQVVAGYVWPILRSRKIGWHQKLDAIAELAALPPTLHAGAALGYSVFVVLLVDGGVTRWLAAVAVLTLLPLASATAVALARDPEPGRVVIALARLPFYAIWRVLLLIETLLFHRESVWRKTERS